MDKLDPVGDDGEFSLGSCPSAEPQNLTGFTQLKNG